MGLDFYAPAYLVLQQTKTNKAWIGTGKRAIIYEEKTKRLNKSEIIQQRWREIDTKQEDKKWKEDEMRDI